MPKKAQTCTWSSRGHGRLEEIRFGIYSDASWCTRPDGSSQGGWITFVATEAEIGGSKPFPLTVIDWSSRKLTRVCRSSLSAEAQTLAAAIDSLEWTKTVFALMIWPALRPDNEEMMRWLGDSPCITDARALFDASNSKAPGMKLAEKRTAIEIKMACERMAAAGGVLKWCNSHQQLADGVTKVSARQKLAMELRRRMHCLRYDPEGTASKKVKQNVRQDEQDSLDQAAQEFQKQQMVKDGIYKIEEMESEEKMECNICLLDGCGLAAEDGKRFCSKRHYHAAKHKQSKTSSAKSTGVIWCMTLANEIVPVAALEYGFVIFLSFDKIIGFFFFLAFALVFAYTLGKRAGRREVHGLMATTEPVETAEGETQAPPTPRTRAVTDCQRFTAAEISFLLGEGYEVWSDDKVEQIRRDFIAELPPSIEDYLPQSEIDKLMAGEETAAQVPTAPEEWNGISRQQREELIQILDDSLLLGVPCGAMCPELRDEARALRAQLATVRVVEGELQPLRVVMSSVPDLPVGTILSSSSGRSNG